MGVLLTKVPMAASMSYTQEWRDRIQEESVAALRGVVYSDKAGTVYVDESDDAGVTSSATATIVVAAATTTEIPWTALTKRWYRFRHVNGVAAQASFVLIQETADFEKTNYLKAMGVISDTAVTNPASSGSFIAFLKGIVKQLQGGGTGAAPVQLTGSTLKGANVAVVTTAGTRVQLPSLACNKVTIIAKRANTGYIYVGMNTVSSAVYGAELASNGSMDFEVSNLNEIYLDSSVSGEGVSYVAI